MPSIRFVTKGNTHSTHSTHSTHQSSSTRIDMSLYIYVYIVSNDVANCQSILDCQGFLDAFDSLGLDLLDIALSPKHIGSVHGTVRGNRNKARLIDGHRDGQNANLG